MSFSIGGALAAIGSSIGSMGSSSMADFIGGWNGNSAKESYNKNVGRTNLNLQAAYDQFSMGLAKDYDQWLYSLADRQYFDLARKYGENTAKWAVQGLRNAGINPILAVQNGSYGSEVPQLEPSGTFKGGGSVKTSGATPTHHAPDLTALAQVKNANSNTAKADAETKTVDQTRSPTVANVNANNAKTVAEADLIQAQAERTRVDTENLRKNEGVNNPSAAAYNLSKKFGSAIKSFVERSQDGSDDSQSVIKLEDGRDYWVRQKELNTAKSVQEAGKTAPVVPSASPSRESPRQRHENSHYSNPVRKRRHN